MKGITIALLFLVISVSVRAQTACGVFANQIDFERQKPTFSFDSDCKMKVRFNRDLVVIDRGEKIRFSSSFIYGYTDGKNTYRAYSRPNLFRNFGYYRVIYDAGVVIYSREMTDYRSRKYIFFYYSESRTSQIFELGAKYYHWKSAGNVVIDVAKLMQGTSHPVSMLHVDFPGI